jgi:hypothetical protein
MIDEDLLPDGPPCAIALLAATLALMTGHAAHAPAARVDADTLQRLIARKIVSNLYFPCHHPDLSPGLHRMLGGLHARCSVVSAQAAQGSGAPDDAACAATRGTDTPLH